MNERLITLEQGSAVFRVAKDPSRPFLVDAGIVVVRATGTQFGVERHGVNITVTVSEGYRCRLSGKVGAEALSSVPLEADEQLTDIRAGKTDFAQVDASGVRNGRTWSAAFNEGNEIRHAVAQFNRSNAHQDRRRRTHRRAADPRRLRANDPASFAATVEADDRRLGSARVAGAPAYQTARARAPDRFSRSAMNRHAHGSALRALLAWRFALHFALLDRSDAGSRRARGSTTSTSANCR